MSDLTEMEGWMRQIREQNLGLEDAFRLREKAIWRDAARYRFLRDHCNHVRSGVHIQFSSTTSDADAAIDEMLDELDREKGE